MTSAGLPSITHRLDGPDFASLSSAQGTLGISLEGTVNQQNIEVQQPPNYYPPPTALGPPPPPRRSQTDRAAASGKPALRSSSTSHRMSPNNNKKQPQIEAIPVTYTPTTHRISKAKKGKKVHVCEYGCGKVFTRAEHRKRHEANHLKEPLYKCSVAGCEKPFQRVDLLNRHLERQHGIQNPGGPGFLHGRRASSAPSSSGMPRSPLLAVNTQIQAQPSPALTNVSHSDAPPFLSPFGYPGRSQTMPLDRRSPVPSSTNTSVTLPSTYEYSSAPSSAQPPGIYSPPSYYEGGATSNWGYPQPAMIYASGAQTEPLTTTVDAAQSYLSYHHPQIRMGLGIDESFTAPTHVGSAESSDAVDPRGSHYGPAQGHRAAAVGPDWLVSVDEESTQHYEQCYWASIDAALPILHRQTYFGTLPNESLKDMVCAMGAQMSPRPAGKFHSRIFAERARVQHSQLGLESLVEQSATATLQAIFLFEYFHLYRSTVPGVYGSAHFAAVYRGLQQSYDGQQYDHSLEEDHDRWVDLECHRRLLVACFLLDMHRQQLFEQPATYTYPSNTPPNLPLPCASALWIAPDSNAWISAKHQDPTSVDATPSSLTTALEHAISLHLHGTISPTAHADPVASTVQLATLVPVKHLLTTASGSCLFAQKVDGSTWHTATKQLRTWATASPDAPVAAWLAGKMLRAHFFPDAPSITSPVGLGAPPVTLETSWCLYLCALVLWAYTFPTTSSIIGSAPLYYSHTTEGAEVGSGPRRAETMPAAIPAPPGLSHPTSATRSTARGNHSHHSSVSAPTPLRVLLDSFAAHSWSDVVPLRGHGKAGSVLEAVSEVIGGRPADPSLVPEWSAAARMTEERGALVAEAVEVLAQLQSGQRTAF